MNRFIRKLIGRCNSVQQSFDIWFLKKKQRLVGLFKGKILCCPVCSEKKRCDSPWLNSVKGEKLVFLITSKPTVTGFSDL